MVPTILQHPQLSLRINESNWNVIYVKGSAYKVWEGFPLEVRNETQ